MRNVEEASDKISRRTDRLSPGEHYGTRPSAYETRTLHCRSGFPRDAEGLAIEAGCEDCCEGELDKVEWQGGQAYLHLGVRRDDHLDASSGQSGRESTPARGLARFDPTDPILTMDRAATAVRTSVSAGRGGPWTTKLCAQLQASRS